MKKWIIGLNTLLCLSLSLAWADSTTTRLGVNTDENTLKTHLVLGDPARIECLVLLGTKSFNHGQFNQARAYFQQALGNINESHYPIFSEVIAQSSLGIMDTIEEHYAQGKPRLDKALQLSPSIEPQYRPVISQIFAQTGKMLIQLEHPEYGNQFLKTALSLNPQCTVCQPVQVKMAAPVVKAPVNSGVDYFSYQPHELVRWREEQPIYVYIASSSHISGWSPQHNMLAQKAFQQWQASTNHRFDFRFTNNPAQSDIQLFWTKEMVNADENGITYDSIVNGYAVIKDVVISLQSKSGKPFEQNKIYGILLHEIGHVLGIAGHSPDDSDLMSAYSDTTTITARDIATLNKIYQSPNALTNPPNITLAEYRKQWHIIDITAVPTN